MEEIYTTIKIFPQPRVACFYICVEDYVKNVDEIKNNDKLKKEGNHEEKYHLKYLSGFEERGVRGHTFLEINFALTSTCKHSIGLFWVHMELKVLQK